MTNFSRQNFPFTIGNDPATTTTGVETVDFEVSTNGAVRVNGPFAVSGTLSAAYGQITNDFGVAQNLSATDAKITGTLEVSGYLSALEGGVGTTFDVSGTLSATAGKVRTLTVIASVSAIVSVPVTAAAFFTIYDATGTPWRVPAYTTLTAP